MEPTDNTILLTGATSGIGKALLHRFHALGNSMIVASSNPSKLKQLQEAYRGLKTITCDLSQEQDVEKLIDECLNDHPEINMLINNAGIQFNYSWLQEPHPNQKIEKEMRVNFLSPLHLIQGLLPLLSTKENSAIINVSSVLAVVPKKSAPVYCASKAALHIFSQAIRYQLESTNIKVFEVLPPLVDTPMTEGRGKGKITPEQLVDEFLKCFRKDIFEINIGKTKLLRSLKRLAPGMADGMLKNN